MWSLGSTEDFGHNYVANGLEVLFYFAFPDDYGPPPRFGQGFKIPLVPLFVPVEFFLPKSGIGFGKPTVGAVIMEVPKTPMHEDGNTVTWQDDIRTPRKILAV